ncbi:alpha/beta hydrolase [Parasutterella secunda]|uniref:alpha/beta fold hydrolase n=1 Tax=Parasutterella secunda TaxID=626947 RepID=UPI0025A41E25|nr:alpha/beta hydrolase [Parasutterella secunda]MDM8226087.1 alpha/beta hydrolase [Parasutterella secunda]
METESSLVNIGPSEFIEGFTLMDARLETEIKMRFAIGGKGPALMLVHGHPHTHIIWRKVAPLLAQKYTVVLPDLRGYGDTDKPESTPDHRPYSKKEMAKDLISLMKLLNRPTFAFVGHDRGARVGHRLALDYPESVTKAVFVDIAPTATMYALTNKEFATKYFWWFFLIQPEPFPEKLIGFDPDYFLYHHIDSQIKIKGCVEDKAFNEYLRCYKDPRTIHAICEDYRAAATIDLDDDKEDADKKIQCPLYLLWGARGTVGKLYDVVGTWKEKAVTVSGEALDCGHSPEEECPSGFLEKVLAFLD